MRSAGVPRVSTARQPELCADQGFFFWVPPSWLVVVSNSQRKAKEQAGCSQD